MIDLPDAATPDVITTSDLGYLRSIARAQRRTLAGAVGIGAVWMSTQAAVPVVLGNTVEAGLVRGHLADLVRGCLLLALLAPLSAITGMVRHRFATTNRLIGALRTQHVIGDRVTGHGPAVGSRATTGEVVQAASTDAQHVGAMMDVVARGSGALVVFVVVTVYLARIDLFTGVFVALGTPILAAASITVVRPLQERQSRHRAAEGELTALGADTVAGLRVLRGIGGEEQFGSRYGERSRQVRTAGVDVAGTRALLRAAHVLLPGIFLAGLTWIAAHGVVAGRLDVGDLVTVYAVAAFLRLPLETTTEVLERWTRARVAAGRIIALITGLPPGTTGSPQTGVDLADGPAASPASSPTPPSPTGTRVATRDLYDQASGVRARAGRLTALVGAEAGTAATIADRIARLDLDPDQFPVLLGTDRLDLESADEVRARVVVSEAEPCLFTGTLRAQIDPFGQADDEQITAALSTSCALDVLSGLSDGLDTRLGERGRELSGGQRQRLALARSLLLAERPECEVLLLVEPTSAVDAHTEARIADRLREARNGRTTLVATTSPLVLDRCDAVVFLGTDRVAVEGTHGGLLDTVPEYRGTVLRENPTDQDSVRTS